MKAVNVFFGANREQNPVLVDVVGQRQLEQDAVNVAARVQLGRDGQNLFGRRFCGQTDRLRKSPIRRQASILLPT